MRGRERAAHAFGRSNVVTLFLLNAQLEGKVMWGVSTDSVKSKIDNVEEEKRRTEVRVKRK